MAEWAPKPLDTDRPNSARIYDYLLGGSTNFAIDRTAADQLVSAFPHVGQWARDNRDFLRRAVRYCATRGIDQFLDLGSGVPTVGNVHEIAHQYAPQARVVYVDWEPIAVTHARNLLEHEPLVEVVEADIRDPHRVLSTPQVTGLLDFRRPVAILALASLHAIPGDLTQVLATYRDACVPGSALIISHGSVVTLSDTQVRDFVAAFNQTPTPAAFRTREEIARLFAGYDLVDPGLVLLPEWHNDNPVTHAQARESNCYVAMGIRPTTPTSG
jgi:uncharacterized protein (DUF1778 family)